MKTVIIILLLLIKSTLILSQNQIVASLPEANILYRNYKNKVQFAFIESTAKKINIKCVNCDTIYPVKNNSFEYIIVPGEHREVKLFISTNNNTSENQIITFNVFNRPTPTIYFGPMISGSILTTVQNMLFVKYPPEIYLKLDFNINNWEISINDRIFKGTGKYLTQEIISYLKNLQNDAELEIKVNYGSIGEDGTSIGRFTILQKVKQTEYKEPEIVID